MLGDNSDGDEMAAANACCACGGGTIDTSVKDPPPTPSPVNGRAEGRCTSLDGWKDNYANYDCKT